MVTATEIFGSYVFQRFLYKINQFDSYFDNLVIVILTFTDHFHQDRFHYSSFNKRPGTDEIHFKYSFVLLSTYLIHHYSSVL